MFTVKIDSACSTTIKTNVKKVEYMKVVDNVRVYTGLFSYIQA